MRLSSSVKLCASVVHIVFVSAVGQSGSALQGATASELSHSLSSVPVVKAALVSVTALMAASLEVNPA